MYIVKKRDKKKNHVYNYTRHNYDTKTLCKPFQTLVSPEKFELPLAQLHTTYGADDSIPAYQTPPENILICI